MLNTKTRRRAQAAVLALCASAALAVPPSAALAAAPGAPTGSCADANYYDGLDVRSAATYCASALTAAGFAPTRFTNNDGTGPVAQLPTDGVFAHAGHSISYASPAGREVGIGSVFVGTDRNTITSLTAEAQGVAYAQGPGQICSDSGGCRAVTFRSLPYGDAMPKFGLAVFQSCFSAAASVDGYKSLADASYARRVGTSIGFTGLVYWLSNQPNANVAGDAWARRFWSDTKAGLSYGTALVNASNAAGGATYGHHRYRILRNANAPAGLRPAAYYTGAV